eukprot:TRINITY_DN4728_c0_g1_i2.p1 TRINITY_DN4728_c0_g1~~TRINITY_DN4728_c0_g1_i2.p1  ORF type:complete len:598 (-),score=119.35 TRINITY_DN4728_c0_g1_i2:420-2213(-)
MQPHNSPQPTPTPTPTSTPIPTPLPQPATIGIPVPPPMEGYVPPEVGSFSVVPVELRRKVIPVEPRVNIIDIIAQRAGATKVVDAELVDAIIALTKEYDQGFLNIHEANDWKQRKTELSCQIELADRMPNTVPFESFVNTVNLIYNLRDQIGNLSSDKDLIKFYQNAIANIGEYSQALQHEDVANIMNLNKIAHLDEFRIGRMMKAMKADIFEGVLQIINGQIGKIPSVNNKFSKKYLVTKTYSLIILVNSDLTKDTLLDYQIRKGIIINSNIRKNIHTLSTNYGDIISGANLELLFYPDEGDECVESQETIFSKVHANTCSEQELLDYLKNNNVNEFDATEYTLLHYASENGNESYIQILLDHGANVGILNRREESAFYLAARNIHIGALKLLVKHIEISYLLGKDAFKMLSLKSQFISAIAKPTIETTVQSFGNYLHSKIHSDCTIKIKSDEQIIHGHKVILSSRSQFFKAIFETWERDEAVIENGSYGAVRTLIEYIYEGSISIPTDINLALEILMLSHQFMLPDLQSYAEWNISQQISTDNILDIFEITSMISEQDNPLISYINYWILNHYISIYHLDEDHEIFSSVLDSINR